MVPALQAPFQNFDFGKSRMTTGNKISLTIFNETSLNACFHPALQLQKVSLKYCGPIFRKSNLIILSEIEIPQIRTKRSTGTDQPIYFNRSDPKQQPYEVGAL